MSKRPTIAELIQGNRIQQQSESQYLRPVHDSRMPTSVVRPTTKMTVVVKESDRKFDNLPSDVSGAKTNVGSRVSTSSSQRTKFRKREKKNPHKTNLNSIINSKIRISNPVLERKINSDFDSITDENDYNVTNGQFIVPGQINLKFDNTNFSPNHGSNCNCSDCRKQQILKKMNEQHIKIEQRRRNTTDTSINLRNNKFADTVLSPAISKKKSYFDIFNNIFQRKGNEVRELKPNLKTANSSTIKTIKGENNSTSWWRNRFSIGSNKISSRNNKTRRLTRSRPRKFDKSKKNIPSRIQKLNNITNPKTLDIDHGSNKISIPSPIIRKPNHLKDFNAPKIKNNVTFVSISDSEANSDSSSTSNSQFSMPNSSRPQSSRNCSDLKVVPITREKTVFKKSDVASNRHQIENVSDVANGKGIRLNSDMIDSYLVEDVYENTMGHMKPKLRYVEKNVTVPRIEYIDTNIGAKTYLYDLNEKQILGEGPKDGYSQGILYGNPKRYDYDHKHREQIKAEVHEKVLYGHSNTCAHIKSTIDNVTNEIPNTSKTGLLINNNNDASERSNNLKNDGHMKNIDTNSKNGVNSYKIMLPTRERIFGSAHSVLKPKPEDSITQLTVPQIPLEEKAQSQIYLSHTNNSIPLPNKLDRETNHDESKLVSLSSKSISRENISDTKASIGNTGSSNVNYMTNLLGNGVKSDLEKGSYTIGELSMNKSDIVQRKEKDPGDKVTQKTTVHQVTSFTDSTENPNRFENNNPQPVKKERPDVLTFKEQPSFGENIESVIEKVMEKFHRKHSNDIEVFDYNTGAFPPQKSVVKELLERRKNDSRNNEIGRNLDKMMTSDYKRSSDDTVKGHVSIAPNALQHQAAATPRRASASAVQCRNCAKLSNQLEKVNLARSSQELRGFMEWLTSGNKEDFGKASELLFANEM